MTRLHLAGVGGNPGQVPGLEGDPHLSGGDRDRPWAHPGNSRPVSALSLSHDDLTSDHDRAGHTSSRPTAPSLKEDGIQPASRRRIQTQHF